MSQTKLAAAWRLHRTGDGVLLVPVEGPEAGSIRIRARERPIPTVPELVARIRSAMPAGSEVTVGPPVRTTTAEGEYAILVHGRARGAVEVERTIGLVLGDDLCAVVDGTTQQPQRFAAIRGTVEKLVNDYALGLGENRRRRYFYTPPPGWDGVAESHATVWLAPGFPNRHGVLTVFDSKPAELSAPLRQDRMLFEDLPLDFARLRTGTLPFASKFNLSGGIDVVFGRNPSEAVVAVHDATLRDARHVYFLRLETDEANLEEHRRAFLELLQTVEPLPSSDPTAPGHWMD